VFGAIDWKLNVVSQSAKWEMRPATGEILRGVQLVTVTLLVKGAQCLN
jgi:hypothetical protein